MITVVTNDGDIVGFNDGVTAEVEQGMLVVKSSKKKMVGAFAEGGWRYVTLKEQNATS